MLKIALRPVIKTFFTDENVNKLEVGIKAYLQNIELQEIEEFVVLLLSNKQSILKYYVNTYSSNNALKRVLFDGDFLEFIVSKKDFITNPVLRPLVGQFLTTENLKELSCQIIKYLQSVKFEKGERECVIGLFVGINGDLQVAILTIGIYNDIFRVVQNYSLKKFLELIIAKFLDKKKKK